MEVSRLLLTSSKKHQIYRSELNYPNQMFRLFSDYLVDGLFEVCTKLIERFFIYHIFCNKMAVFNNLYLLFQLYDRLS